MNFAFYGDVLDFAVVHRRQEERFAPLAFGAEELMLEERRHRTGDESLLVRQCVVADPDDYLSRLQQLVRKSA